MGFDKDPVEIGGLWAFAPSGLFRLKIAKVWKEREEVGDPGSSCKYNLFISDSGCRVIKVALSQREGVFSWACLLLTVNTDLGVFPACSVV